VWSAVECTLLRASLSGCDVCIYRCFFVSVAYSREILCYTSCYRQAHCKNIRIFTDILWRVFHILMEPVQCTFVSVNQRNNEARAHVSPVPHCNVGPGFRRFTDTNPYRTGAVKMLKSRHKISVDIRIFFYRAWVIAMSSHEANPVAFTNYFGKLSYTYDRISSPQPHTLTTYYYCCTLCTI